jgi:hypothetical protein
MISGDGRKAALLSCPSVNSVTLAPPGKIFFMVTELEELFCQCFRPLKGQLDETFPFLAWLDGSRRKLLPPNFINTFTDTQIFIGMILVDMNYTAQYRTSEIFCHVPLPHTSNSVPNGRSRCPNSFFFSLYSFRILHSLMH